MRLWQAGKKTAVLWDITERLLDAKLVQGTNTTIGVVATNATLTPAEVHRIAEMAHDGMARAIRPSHTMFDGDTLFFPRYRGTYWQQCEYRRYLGSRSCCGGDCERSNRLNRLSLHRFWDVDTECVQHCRGNIV